MMSVPITETETRGEAQHDPDDLGETHHSTDEAQHDPSVDQNPARRLKTCKTWWFVELVLIIYFFSEFPVDFVGQKYILEWVKEDKIRQDAHRNISHDSNTTISPCDANISLKEYEFQQSIQSYSSNFAVVESLIAGIPATIVTVLLGVSSDRFGRRFAILPPLLGVLLSSSVVMLVVYFKASIYFLFIGDLLYGCCGSFTAMTMGCFSYVADRTAPERRMIRITLLEMCMLVSGVVSPISLGPLVDAVGYVIVLLIIVLMSAVNFVYTCFLLKDINKSVEEPSEISNPKNCLDPSLAVIPCETPLSVSIQQRISRPTVSGTLVMDEPNLQGYISASINSSLPIHSSINSNGLNYEPNHDRNAAGFNIHTLPHSDSNNEYNITHSRHALLPAAIPKVETVSASTGKAFILAVCSHLKSSTRLFTHHPQVLSESEGNSERSATNRRFKLNILLLAFLITNMPTLNFSLATLFEMNSPLCWNVNTIGLFAGVSLGIATVGAIIVTPIMKCFLEDHSIALIASATLVLSTAYKAFVTTTFLMMLSPSLSMFSILAIPSIRSIMSSLVSDNEQGAVFGVIACAEVICSVTGTIIFNSIYSATIRFMTGFVFLAMTAFYIFGGICLIIYRVFVWWERRGINYQHLSEDVVTRQVPSM